MKIMIKTAVKGYRTDELANITTHLIDTDRNDIRINDDNLEIFQIYNTPVKYEDRDFLKVYFENIIDLNGGRDNRIIKDRLCEINRETVEEFFEDLFMV